MITPESDQGGLWSLSDDYKSEMWQTLYHDITLTRISKVPGLFELIELLGQLCDILRRFPWLSRVLQVLLLVSLVSLASYRR